MFGFLFVLPSHSNLSGFLLLVILGFILWVWFAHFCGLEKKKQKREMGLVW